MILKLPAPRQMQTSIRDYVPSSNANGSGENILPSGDPRCTRTDDDGLFRVGSNNTNGVELGKNGLEISGDIDTTDELGFDVMGLQETKIPWTASNRRLYNQQCRLKWPQGATTVFSSAPWEYTDSTYQSGGTLLLVHGHHKGRHTNSGSDPWGRFCWMTLRGGRDEGIILINAYRCCHTKSDNPGPFTAYAQQRTGLRSMGLKDPDPRQQILSDLLDLIDEKRSQGYRPILMWDANEDWVKQSHKEQGNHLKRFMSQANLTDPFFNKFQYAPRTFIDSNNRLDYIMVDPALESAIKNIGYLGSLEGNFSDHVMAYVDFDEKKLFNGLLNRPTEISSREFLLEQDDKKLKFTTAARTQCENHKIAERVFALAAAFVASGCTPENLSTYNKLDNQIIDIITAAAKQSGRKNFGYMRSEDLTTAGQTLLLYKCLLSCKLRRQPPTHGCHRSAQRLAIDISDSDSLTFKQLRQRVYKARRDLWAIQKDCEERRIQWIDRLAEDRAKAAGDVGWADKLAKMKKKVEEFQVNRKLSAVIKGTHRQLDRIQIPTGNWYYSYKSKEIYHYDMGVWEAYPRKEPRPHEYFRHHTLKVVPDDAVPISVTTHDECIVIDEFLPNTQPMWRDITSTKDIEDHLLWRNKRHLQQTAIEGGTSTTEVLRRVRADHGLSSFNDDILEGKPMTDIETPPEVIDWFWAIARPNKAVNPVTGVITKEAYQDMFLRRESTLHTLESTRRARRLC